MTVMGACTLINDKTCSYPYTVRVTDVQLQAPTVSSLSAQHAMNRSPTPAPAASVHTSRIRGPWIMPNGQVLQSAHPKEHYYSKVHFYGGTYGKHRWSASPWVHNSMQASILCATLYMVIASHHTNTAGHQALNLGRQCPVSVPTLA